MPELDNLNCCGIKEIVGITGYKPETILKNIGPDWFDDTPRAYLVFSCQSVEVSGRKLATYIRQNNLGTIARTRCKVNPNSSNLLSVWLWSVNNKTLKEWVIRNTDWRNGDW